MKREKLRRFLFVAAACLLSIPWLTPCAGILSAAIVDGARTAVTHRDRAEARLPTKQLNAWSGRRGPPFKVRGNQVIPSSLLIRDEELSAAHGGRAAPSPGTLLSRGGSALVDGVTGALILVDPVTWLAGFGKDVLPARTARQLVICENPFVVLHGKDVRYIREGRNGPVTLAKARDARVTIITPDGGFSESADFIHFRGPSNELVLENAHGLRNRSASIKLAPNKPGLMVKLDFVKRTAACNADIGGNWYGL